MTTETNIGISVVVRRSARGLDVSRGYNSVLVLDNASGRRIAEYSFPPYCDPQLEAMHILLDVESHIRAGGTIGNYQW
jgi:hypothetical protein